MNHRASKIKTFPQSNPQPAAALNTYWTEGSRTLDAAKRAGLASAYHHHFGEAQGAESIQTLYWRGAGQKTYHIDYALISEEWLPRLQDVSVGSKQDWIDSRLSDHVPLVVDLADTEASRSRAE
jgi:hypothetical protein